MRALLIVPCVCALAVVAEADNQQLATLAAKLLVNGDIDGVKPPRLAISYGNQLTTTPDQAGINERFAIGDAATQTIAVANDGKAGWIATDLHGTATCGMGDCDKAWQEAGKTIAFHYTLLVDSGQPVVFHLARTIDDAALAKTKELATPSAITSAIDKGAEPVAKLFRDSLADPKLFAAAVSDRKDVVLFGTDQKERYLGGATVKKILGQWALAMTVRDGVMAGITSSKTVAWVAANVDAKGKTDKRATPYRLTVIYEQTASGWKAVQIHFSYN